MDIDDLTIKQAREIASLFGTATTSKPAHPLEGKAVLAVLPNGFIHFGTLYTEPHGYRLENASNLRRWSTREGGLPEFAKNGPTHDDSIDEINGPVYIESCLYFISLGFEL